MTRIRWQSALVALACLLLLSACGKKGPVRPIDAGGSNGIAAEEPDKPSQGRCN